MAAKETAVTNLISVELCAECPLREGHIEEPNFLQRAARSTSSMQTAIDVISDDSVTQVFVDGIRTSTDIIKAFENCTEPTNSKSIFSSRRLGCKAIEAMKARQY